MRRPPVTDPQRIADFLAEIAEVQEKHDMVIDAIDEGAGVFRYAVISGGGVVARIRSNGFGWLLR